MRRVCAFTTLEVDIFIILATTVKPGSQLVAPGRSESFAIVATNCEPGLRTPAECQEMEEGECQY